MEILPVHNLKISFVGCSENTALLSYAELSMLTHFICNIEKQVTAYPIQKKKKNVFTYWEAVKLRAEGTN